MTNETDFSTQLRPAAGKLWHLVQQIGLRDVAVGAYRGRALRLVWVTFVSGLTCRACEVASSQTTDFMYQLRATDDSRAVGRVGGALESLFLLGLIAMACAALWHAVAGWRLRRTLADVLADPAEVDTTDADRYARERARSLLGTPAPEPSVPTLLAALLGLSWLLSRAVTWAWESSSP